MGSKIDFNINIIEIPGFGHVEKDKQIVNRIREYFTTKGEQGIACLDAVCLVIPASTTISPEQKYIFDAILSIFDKKVAENMLILATFGDGEEPQVTEALNAADVPYKRCLQVNNAAWFGSNKNKKSPNEIYWDMSFESFKTLFLEIEKAESISLLLTQVVLKNREKIEVAIRGLLPQIEEGTNKLNTLQEEVNILQQHKTELNRNKEFKYKVTETHQRKIDLETGKYVTNCLQCNRTCHYPCHIPDDDDKADCAAMSDGYCMICPGKCYWEKHKNNSYRFEIYPVEVEKTAEDIKQKYFDAQQKTNDQKAVIQKVKEAFNLLQQDVSKTIQKVAGYITELNTIAYKPDHLGVADYIEIVIENEKKEKKPGWDNRTKIYSKMRDEANLMSRVQDRNFTPWNVDELLKSD